MRKRIIGSTESSKDNTGHTWLDLEVVASVEVSSEDPRYPIESVFGSAAGPGWRASEPGKQEILIVFDRPTALERIQLRFVEPNSHRTQEFSLKWSSAAGGPPREIVRQQWNFSPASSTELEEYTVDLNAVSMLELAITPDISRRDAFASLASWRLK